MTATKSPARPQKDRDAGLRALSHLQEARYLRVEPPILQPASIFLDLSGEEIRGRLFLTSDASGAELCLRPDYTIPVCRAYLDSAKPGALAQYCYLGPIFRSHVGQAAEAVQTGLESYGRDDAEAADAEIIALALEAAQAAGAGELNVRMGDVHLFDRVLHALGLPDVWSRRLRRGLARGRPLEAILGGASAEPAAHSGVLAAMERADHAGARALVEDLLAIAGITAVGGRSVGEIADRFLDSAALRAEASAPQEKRAILAQFLKISGEPDAASAKLRKLAKDAKLNIAAALDSLDQRVGFLAARGVSLERCTFAAAFVRDIGYYTGCIFEGVESGHADAKPVLGGGRYDGLARRLGAGRDIPAVGAAVFLDRLHSAKERL